MDARKLILLIIAISAMIMIQTILVLTVLKITQVYLQGAKFQAAMKIIASTFAGFANQMIRDILQETVLIPWNYTTQQNWKIWKWITESGKLD